MLRWLTKETNSKSKTMISKFGNIINDPTRRITLKPETFSVEPTKEPKWYQKIWSSFRRFLESDFVFYTTIALVRVVEVSLFVLAFYFMQGGRL